MSGPIRVERLMKAPPSAVYAHLTESAKWAKWQGVGAEIDAREGGIFRMTMPTGLTARGQFTELVPNRRVVFSWGWVDHPGLPPGSSTVEIELDEVPGGTRVRLTHHGLPPDEVVIHTMGWDHYLPRLARAAEGADPGPDPGPG